MVDWQSDPGWVHGRNFTGHFSGGGTVLGRVFVCLRVWTG